MTKKHIPFTLSVLLSALLFSCSKTTNPVSTIVTPTYSSMDTIFSMLSLQPKTLTVDAATGGSFYGSSGTRYIFEGNSFQTATGVNVTGNVQIQVCEYLNKGDMLFSKMLPISNNEPLLSGGEISVIATQGGERLYLKPHFFFNALVPQSVTPPAGMQLFTGQPNLDTSNFKINWIIPVRDSTKYNVGVWTTATLIH